MKLNDVGRITFRFTPREIGAMLMLMGARSLPGTDIPAAAPGDDVRQSLIGDGIVTQIADRVLLDRTVALILKNCVESRQRVEAAGPSGRAVLYAGAQICVLAGGQPSMVTLEPFPGPAQALLPFETMAAALGEPVKLALYRDDRREAESDAPEALRALCEGLGKK